LNGIQAGILDIIEGLNDYKENTVKAIRITSDCLPSLMKDRKTAPTKCNNVDMKPVLEKLSRLEFEERASGQRERELKQAIEKLTVQIERNKQHRPCNCSQETSQKNQARNAAASPGLRRGYFELK
jgi:hypothetical protein